MEIFTCVQWWRCRKLPKNDDFQWISDVFSWNQISPNWINWIRTLSWKVVFKHISNHGSKVLCIWGSIMFYIGKPACCNLGCFPSYWYLTTMFSTHHVQQASAPNLVNDFTQWGFPWRYKQLLPMFQHVWSLISAIVLPPHVPFVIVLSYYLTHHIVPLLIKFYNFVPFSSHLFKHVQTVCFSWFGHILPISPRVLSRRHGTTAGSRRSTGCRAAAGHLGQFFLSGSTTGAAFAARF